MKYKPSWQETEERLSKLWYGEKLDRPCIGVTAPAEQAGPVAPPPPENLEDKWLDPDLVIQQTKATLANRWWGGESIPSVLLMGCWCASLGGKPVFKPNTIWFEHIPVDFSQPSPFRYDPQDIWVEKVEKLLLEVAKFAGHDDFQVGAPCILPANDLLSMHMGTDEFMISLMEEPNWMKNAIIQGAQDGLHCTVKIMEMVKQSGHRFWYGLAGWMPFWAPEPYISTQSDVSCMLSPEMFREFVVPELDILGNHFGNLWYHLDGNSAAQHLETLLSLPYLKMLQYTPTSNIEQANGPAHFELYRKAQNAGKIVHIQLPAENIKPLLEMGLDPQLVMFDTAVSSPEAGRQLLEYCRI